MSDTPTKEQQLQNKLKEVEIKERETTRKVKEYEAFEKQEKLKVEKLDTLRCLCTMLTVDASNPIGEQKLKPIMDDSEMQTIKDKMFKIIHTL